MSQPDYSMIVDIVDGNNIPVGTARRGDLFRENQNFRTVHALIFDALGRMILQRLPKDHPRNPNRLGSSVAGYVKSGETYQQAAYRKSQSELGLHDPLSKVADFMMIDDGCRKYVEVFRGQTQTQPHFDRNEIAELVSIDVPRLDDCVRLSPDLFTPTFLYVYREWRSRDR